MAADTLTATTSSSASGINTGNTTQASVGIIQSLFIQILSVQSKMNYDLPTVN